MFCSMCGQQLNDGANFCTKCGARVGGQTMPQVKPAPAPQPVQQVQPAPAPQPVQQVQPAPAPQPVPQAQPVQQVQPAPVPQPVPQAQPVQQVQPAPAPQPIQQVQPVQQAQPVQQVQPAPVPQAQPAQQAGPLRLWFKPDGGGFVNYSMKFVDMNGQTRYTAKTVSESFTQYTFKAWYPNNQEAFKVQTKTKKFATMYFEMTAPNGQLITSIDQQISGASFAYSLPEAGLYTRGDVFNFDFSIERNGQCVAQINRDATFIKDSYQVVIYDPYIELPVLGLVLALEIDTIHRRHKRRRR